MSLTFRISLLTSLLATACTLVEAQSATDTPVKTIPAPNGNQGWCYYCSDDNAPPLCNSQCTTAINRLCAEDLTLALTTTEQDCEIQYVPPVWEFRDPKASIGRISETECLNNFNGILSNCGKDAGTPTSGVNASYCTASGGGGTAGWQDDGTPITGSARFVVKTKGTDQCGQAQAPWQQATSVIPWDDSWVSPNDQVVLVTDPPSAATASAAFAAMSNFPTPNPACQTQPCNIYGVPYFADSPRNPWEYGQAHMLRHRVTFEGWDPEDGAVRFFNSLHDRCQQWPDNWQVYKNGSESVADFNLISWEKSPARPAIFDNGFVTDYCWCISYALFDASVGIALPVNAFCLAGTQFPSTAEFAGAKKRGLELDEPGLFASVDKLIAKREAMAAKAKRDLIQDISGVEREWS
ncbi:hypothetical protein ACLMJK_001980 [Lecanora helva]